MHVDMCEANKTNKAISRKRDLLPILDEVIHGLSGATVFGKLTKSGLSSVAVAPLLKAYYHLL